MISDITLGQYFPKKSLMHRADPRMKICLVIYAIILLFVAGNFVTLALAVLYIWRGHGPVPDSCKALSEKLETDFVPGGLYRSF